MDSEDKMISITVPSSIALVLVFFAFVIMKGCQNDIQKETLKTDRMKTCISAGNAPERCATYEKMI